VTVSIDAIRRGSLFVALALFAVACGGGTRTTTPTPAATEELTPEEAAVPAVEITYPQEGGDPIPSGDVLVAVTVRSFGIVDRIGGKPKAGEGHLVYYLDVEDVPTKDGRSAIADGSERSAASAMTSHTWKDVGPGPHTLGVQLVNSDDTPLDPPQTDEVRIVVGGG
jgi:hypothetical protein